MRFWVRKGSEQAPRLGIALRGGDAHFSFGMERLNATLKEMPAGHWKQVEVRLDKPSSAWPRDNKFDVATVDRLVIAVGDNRTTRDTGRVVFIDDMELVLTPPGG